MGVSAYFSWIVKHFSKELIFDIDERSFDNLYFDFNSLIHPASRRRDGESPSKMISETLRYFRYVLEVVRPTKRVYIAFDGVPPMAKINQQRLRRFKAIYERERKRKIYEKHGMKYEGEKSDYNMISPGTKFMKVLSRKLNEYVTKLKTSDNYRDVKFTISDTRECGEGEHKIISHIRKKTSFEQNCIYGLDSDLLFLTLSLPQPKNIQLIREDIFGLSKETVKNSNIEKYVLDGIKTFNYLEIGKLYDKMVYILGDVNIHSLGIYGFEMSQKWYDTISYSEENMFEENIETDGEVMIEVDEKLYNPITNQNIIVDYMFICFMLGNDFLSTVPSMKIIGRHTIEDGLSNMIFAYKICLSNLKTNLIKYKYNTNTNTYDELNINTLFMKKFLKILYETEDLRFHEKHIMDMKRIRRLQNEAHMKANTFEKEMFYYDNVEIDMNFRDMHFYMGNQINENWDKEYYVKKLGYDYSLNYETFCSMLSHDYFKGMLWNISYYLTGCIDWGWYYSYEGSPLLRDLYLYISEKSKYQFLNAGLYNFNDKHTAMDEVEQLLCILPPQSNEYLPTVIRKYVTRRDSPIIMYFPTSVMIDVIGKRFMWECHAKLPPIDYTYYRHVFSDVIKPVIVEELRQRKQQRVLTI